MQRSLLKTRWSFQGALSSVGLAAIQIANSVGAKSIALTRTNAKRKQLIDGGAKYVIATEEEDLARGAQDAAGVTPLFGKAGGRWQHPDSWLGAARRASC